MATVVACIGGIAALFGLIGVINPDATKRFSSHFLLPPAWHVALVVRLVVGVILIVAGPSCRPDMPWVGWAVRAMGVLAFAAATAFLLLGNRRSMPLVDWLFVRPLTFWRGMLLSTFVFGLFLIYAGT